MRFEPTTPCNIDMGAQPIDLSGQLTDNIYEKLAPITKQLSMG